MVDFIVMNLSNCVLEMNFFQNLPLFLPLEIDAILDYFTMIIIEETYTMLYCYTVCYSNMYSYYPITN